MQWYDNSDFVSGSSTLTDKSRSVNGRTAILYSNVSITTLGGYNYLYFNGNGTSSGGYVYYPTSLGSELSSSSYNQTQEVWIRCVDNTTNNNVTSDASKSAGVVITEIGQTLFDTGWHDSQIEVVNGNIKMRVWNSNPITVASTSGTDNAPLVDLSKWIHLAWRYSAPGVLGPTGVLDGFLNGQKTATIGYSRLKPTDYGSGYFSVLGHSDFTNLGSGNYFKGYIAKYRNYNKSLSDDIIYQNYLAERGFFNPH